MDNINILLNSILSTPTDPTGQSQSQNPVASKGSQPNGTSFGTVLAQLTSQQNQGNAPQGQQASAVPTSANGTNPTFTLEPNAVTAGSGPLGNSALAFSSVTDTSIAITESVKVQNETQLVQAEQVLVSMAAGLSRLLNLLSSFQSLNSSQAQNALVVSGAGQISQSDAQAILNDLQSLIQKVPASENPLLLPAGQQSAFLNQMLQQMVSDQQILFGASPAQGGAAGATMGNLVGSGSQTVNLQLLFNDLSSDQITSSKNQTSQVFVNLENFQMTATFIQPDTTTPTVGNNLPTTGVSPTFQPLSPSSALINNLNQTLGGANPSSTPGTGSLVANPQNALSQNFNNLVQLLMQSGVSQAVLTTFMNQQAATSKSVNPNPTQTPVSSNVPVSVTAGTQMPPVQPPPPVENEGQANISLLGEQVQPGGNPNTPGASQATVGEPNLAGNQEFIPIQGLTTESTPLLGGGSSQAPNNVSTEGSTEVAVLQTAIPSSATGISGSNNGPQQAAPPKIVLENVEVPSVPAAPAADVVTGNTAGVTPPSGVVTEVVAVPSTQLPGSSNSTPASAGSNIGAPLPSGVVTPVVAIQPNAVTNPSDVNAINEIVDRLNALASQGILIPPVTSKPNISLDQILTAIENIQAPAPTAGMALLTPTASIEPNPLNITSGHSQAQFLPMATSVNVANQALTTPVSAAAILNAGDELVNPAVLSQILPTTPNVNHGLVIPPPVNTADIAQTGISAATTATEGTLSSTVFISQPTTTQNVLSQLPTALPVTNISAGTGSSAALVALNTNTSVVPPEPSLPATVTPNTAVVVNPPAPSSTPAANAGLAGNTPGSLNFQLQTASGAPVVNQIPAPAPTIPPTLAPAPSSTVQNVPAAAVAGEVIKSEVPVQVAVVGNTLNNQPVTTTVQPVSTIQPLGSEAVAPVSSLSQSSNGSSVDNNLNQNISNNNAVLEAASLIGTSTGSTGNTHGSFTQAINTASSNLPNSNIESSQILNQITQQVAAQMDSARTVSRLNFQLIPENLGRVTIQVALVDQAVSARIFVTNPDVRDAIQHHMVDLKTALNQAGLQIDQLQVQVQGGSTNLLSQYYQFQQEGYGYRPFAPNLQTTPGANQGQNEGEIAPTPGQTSLVDLLV